MGIYSHKNTSGTSRLSHFTALSGVLHCPRYRNIRKKLIKERVYFCRLSFGLVVQCIWECFNISGEYSCHSREALNRQHYFHLGGKVMTRLHNDTNIMICLGIKKLRFSFFGWTTNTNNSLYLSSCYTLTRFFNTILEHIHC